MADIIFVNPSVNQYRLAKSLKAFGSNVEVVVTEDMPQVDSSRIFYFFVDHNICFTSKSRGLIDDDESIFLFKPTILSKYRILNLVKKYCKNIKPELIHGNYIDVMLLKRGLVDKEDCKKVKLKDVKRYKNIDNIILKNPMSHIFTSTLIGSGNIKLSYWETDFDINETIGKDYFVIFSDNSRVELFSYKDKVVTISNHKNPIEALYANINVLKKFNFKLEEEINIQKNYSPWLLKSHIPNLTILNDYSYFNNSINMPLIWFEKLACYIMNYTKK